jgi:Rieske Fe-S protein
MEGQKFQVFAINCAHLGCPVRWFEQSRLFMCPCHGGVYYEDGSRASGPPPRGLYEYNHKVENGELVQIPETFTKSTAERAARTRKF